MTELVRSAFLHNTDALDPWQRVVYNALKSLPVNGRAGPTPHSLRMIAARANMRESTTLGILRTLRHKGFAVASEDQKKWGRA